MPHPKVKIADNSGNEVAVTSNALDVNIAGGASIDIGDVDIHLSGNVPLLGNAGNVAAGVLRVTLAGDDPAVVDLAAMEALLITIDSDTSSIRSSANTLAGQLKTIGDDTYSEGVVGGRVAAVVRNDTLAALAGTDNEFAPLQVNAEGALYTTGNTLQNGLLHGENFTVMGESKTIDGSALPNIVAEGRNARLAVSRSGIAYACLTDPNGASDLGTTITTHLSEIEGAVETIEGVVSGSEMQVDVVASLPAGTNAIGKLSANSGVDIGDVDVTSIAAGTNIIGKVSHDITGLASDDNPTVGTSAEAITTDGADGAAACKRMDIMAHPSNTGEIWVGDAAVTVNGLNGGIRLLPGDVYSIDIDNTGDVYVIATVDGENVSYNYFT